MNANEKILVLRSFKHGESDLIVHGLNTQGARIGLIAKGGAKSRKRFSGGVLEATNYIEVTYRVAPARDTDPLHFLVEAHIVREFPGLRRDYDRLNAALYLLKLISKISAAGVVDSPETFNLLGNALAAAETSANIDRLKVHFEIKLLAAQGVLPHDEQFLPWIHTALAKHEAIACRDEDWQWVVAQVHEHLRTYLDLRGESLA